MNNHHKETCSVCGKPFSVSDLPPGRFMRFLIALRITAEHPEWSADSEICRNDLNHDRSMYVQNVLEQARSELSTLEKDVIESLRDHDILTRNLNDVTDAEFTFGERLAEPPFVFACTRVGE